MTPEEHADTAIERFLEASIHTSAIWAQLPTFKKCIAAAIREHEVEVRMSYRQGWRAALTKARERIDGGKEVGLEWDDIEKELGR